MAEALRRVDALPDHPSAAQAADRNAPLPGPEPRAAM